MGPAGHSGRHRGYSSTHWDRPRNAGHGPAFPRAAAGTDFCPTKVLSCAGRIARPALRKACLASCAPQLSDCRIFRAPAPAGTLVTTAITELLHLVVAGAAKLAIGVQTSQGKSP